MRKRPSPANLTGTSGRSELRHRTSIGPGGVLPAAVCAACRQSDEHTPAGPEPRSTPCPPDSPADLPPPRGQPPGGAPEWLLWAPCTTASPDRSRAPIRRSGPVRLHEKVAQQLRRRRKRAGQIMEDYACLCINARIGNVRSSADEDG